MFLTNHGVILIAVCDTPRTRTTLRAAQLLPVMLLLVQVLRGPAQCQEGWGAGMGTHIVVLKALPCSLLRKAAGCGVAAGGFWLALEGSMKRLALVAGEHVSQVRGLQAQEPESKAKCMAAVYFSKYCHEHDATHEKSIVGGPSA